jgi:DNA-binding transcriptional ArsR family regulator
METGGVTTEPELPQLTVRDPRVMRALAHPARFAIMDHLMAATGVTATECAEVTGLSPSATSYHLRALARAGLVEEAPSRGDARERVWRSKVRGVEVEAEGNDPESYAAGRDLIEVLLGRQDLQVRSWIERSPTQTREWRDASTISEARLLMTANELADFVKQVRDLLEPYLASRRQATQPPGARRVSVAFRAYPTD